MDHFLLNSSVPPSYLYLKGMMTLSYVADIQNDMLNSFKYADISKMAAPTSGACELHNIGYNPNAS